MKQSSSSSTSKKTPNTKSFSKVLKITLPKMKKMWYLAMSHMLTTPPYNVDSLELHT